jgi:transcription antitermination factor NusG
MPILGREVSVFPERLLEANAWSDDGFAQGSQWYLVYTRSRHEKTLARHMHSNAMYFYLPLISKEQFFRGKRVQSYLPVFSGYLFYFGDSPDRLFRLASSCVSSVLAVPNQTALVSELRGVQSLIATGIPLTVEAKLIPGQRVRIKSGSMKGLEGTILRRKSGIRLMVSVNYLQQGVSMEIDDFMLESI